MLWACVMGVCNTPLRMWGVWVNVGEVNEILVGISSEVSKKSLVLLCFPISPPFFSLTHVGVSVFFSPIDGRGAMLAPLILAQGWWCGITKEYCQEQMANITSNLRSQIAQVYNCSVSIPIARNCSTNRYQPLNLVLVNNSRIKAQFLSLAQ